MQKGFAWTSLEDLQDLGTLIASFRCRHCRLVPHCLALRTPTVGLEPTTTRLRALRSADWARRAVLQLHSHMHMKTRTYIHKAQSRSCCLSLGSCSTQLSRIDIWTIACFIFFSTRILVYIPCFGLLSQWSLLALCKSALIPRGYSLFLCKLYNIIAYHLVTQHCDVSCFLFSIPRILIHLSCPGLLSEQSLSFLLKFAWTPRGKSFFLC